MYTQARENVQGVHDVTHERMEWNGMEWKVSEMEQNIQKPKAWLQVQRLTCPQFRPITPLRELFLNDVTSWHHFSLK